MSQILYTVYNNDTDDLIILDGTSEESAKAMNISPKSFYSTVSKVKSGKLKKWHIEVSRDTIKFGRERRTLSGWAKVCNMSLTTLQGRLKRGWNVEKALFTPVKIYNKRDKNGSNKSC